MGRPKGSPKTGGGSRAGRPNKITSDLKTMILGALDGAGGVSYLTRQASDNPAAFLTLVGKVLPLQVAGDASSPITLQIIERRIVKSE